MSDKAFNALERFAEKSASHQTLLGQMTQRFDPFSELIRNVELGMAKADLDIARLYSGLVTNADLRTRVFALLDEELVRTRRTVLRAGEHRELLRKNRVLSRSDRLRHP